MNRKYFLDEVWKPVVGYEGLYLISNYGRMRNLNYRGKGETEIMRLNAIKGHCIIVGLVKNGVKKQYRVHRLVAQAFLDAPEEGFNIVIHRNGNVQDNRAVNLQWVDTVRGRVVSDTTRLLISYALMCPSKARRERISEGQLIRYARERETKTGRYSAK